jgi:hypothetical protein
VSGTAAIAEWHETIHKARGPLTAIGGVEASS